MILTIKILITQTTKTMKNNKTTLRVGTHQTVKILALTVVILLSLIGFGCQGGEKAGVNIAKSPTPERIRDYFQEALSSVQAGGFDFIFTFRRTDGEPLTGDDKKFLKQNAPPDTNRWNLTEDGKIAIAGSNYKFTPENMEALKARFIIENYSKVKEENNENGNNNSSNTK